MDQRIRRKTLVQMRSAASTYDLRGRQFTHKERTRITTSPCLVAGAGFARRSRYGAKRSYLDRWSLPGHIEKGPVSLQVLVWLRGQDLRGAAVTERSGVTSTVGRCPDT